MAIIKNNRRINVGRIVNDGLGDDIRTAFQKINGNFDDYENLIDIALSRDANNVGHGAKVFKEKRDNILEFKTLLSGRYTVIEEIGDSIQISSSSPQPFTRIDTNQGTVLANNTPEITFEGGEDIVINAAGSQISVDARQINGRSIRQILGTYDFGPAVGDFANPLQFDLANTNIDFGTVEIPSNTNLNCGTL